VNRLKIVLHIQSLAAGKGGAERVATDLADEMCLRGHNVYMAYKDRGPPAYNAEQAVNYLPYKTIKDLRVKVRSLDPSVFFSFYVDHLIIDNYSVVYDTNIPFGMQECTNPTRAIERNWRKGQQSRHQSLWEREIIASGAHRIRLVMPKYVNSFPDYIRRQVRGFSNPAFPQHRIAKHEKCTDKEKIIVCIGGMKKNKNFTELLKAFILLKEEFPKWKINIFGKDTSDNTPYIAEIKRLICENSLHERVLICGPSDDIIGELARSDLHIISSLEEGCPTCVLEAMSVGLPSIGFAECAGTNELIVDGVNGLLASSEDRVQSLALAMRKLMTSEKLRSTYGAKALADSKSFVPDVTYDQWEKLFYEASSYKNKPEKLFLEQMQINPELALHSRRMLHNLMRRANYEGN
jgi:glycosyltransferase involved in cell wall biosynthesis